jgi:MtfA peptidase
MWKLFGNILQLVHLRKASSTVLQEYATIISRYFRYFNELTLPEQQAFLLRVHKFRNRKKFHYIGLEPQTEPEVLISAAAIQLTFGLKKYKFPFFKHIYITASEYTVGFNITPWAGHVNRQGIYISWKHFLQGYKSFNSRNNVGLHEMAHAFEYEMAVGDYYENQDMQLNFDRVKRKLGGILFEAEWNRGTYFSAQGVHNVHECWAESVELFFQEPDGLYLHYPELYNNMKQLLNQDPLRKKRP